jgi:hypothetical protein
MSSARGSTTGARPAGCSIPSGPYIYNLWGDWLLKIDRITGQVVYRVDIASKPELVAWWDEEGWQGGPGPYTYAIDSVSGDLFLALNGLSRTTFVRLDSDTVDFPSAALRITLVSCMQPFDVRLCRGRLPCEG